MSPAETAEPIEMPFGLWTRVGRRNYVLDGMQIPHVKAHFYGDRDGPYRPKIRHTAVRELCKTIEPVEMPFEYAECGCGLGWS